jgi:hypothetical protein
MRGYQYDYLLYEVAPEEAVVKEKPTCFDCPSDLWCGDCEDALRCMSAENCGACEFEPECGLEQPDVPTTFPLAMFEESQPTKAFIASEDPHDEAYEGDEDMFEEELKTIAEVEDSFAPSDAYLEDMAACEDMTADMREEEDQRESYPPSEEYLKAIAEEEEDNPHMLNGHLEASEEDVVLHPNHYAEADIPSGIECWDWYELAMTEAEVTGHFKGNALKYIFRAGKKGNAIEDLEKARNYLARWIGYLNGDRTVHMRGKKHDG